MVLARSLRDAGTKKKVAVMVTVDSMSPSTLEVLKKVYDYILPVERIVNKNPANLYLMHRPDLISVFTKIQLWRQIQFRRAVYVDADMVCIRAPDELFERASMFAAAPDIGWPDCFNSGLMALTPNMGDYYALLALAERGISFDGADQGLLNMHFTNYDRISFSYNCTPSAHYQYAPAYRHFQSTISMVHFIGDDKPWRVGRESGGTTGAYSELLGRWWAVYDKHYRLPVRPFLIHSRVILTSSRPRLRTQGKLPMTRGLSSNTSKASQGPQATGPLARHPSYTLDKAHQRCFRPEGPSTALVMWDMNQPLQCKPRHSLHPFQTGIQQKKHPLQMLVQKPPTLPSRTTSSMSHATSFSLLNMQNHLKICITKFPISVRQRGQRRYSRGSRTRLHQRVYSRTRQQQRRHQLQLLARD